MSYRSELATPYFSGFSPRERISPRVRSLILSLGLGLFFLAGSDFLWGQQPAPDYGAISAKKIGIDLRIGLNQASAGGILHLSSLLALNPYVLYRNREQTNNYLTEPGSSTASTYNTSKDSYFGVGGFVPVYIARIEDLHIRLMPGASYAAGQTRRSQSSGTSLVYDQSANITYLSLQLFLGLQYALTRHLHVIGELGYSYSEIRILLHG